jgi:hypothetical protein
VVFNLVMHTPRPRTPVSRTKLLLARPFFRYSYWRDAYVLRVVGNSRGPVLVAARPEVETPGQDRDRRFAKDKVPSGRGRR